MNASDQRSTAGGGPGVLLFDLGGVLVDWAGIDSIGELSDLPIERETARRFWLESPWIRRFETGRCTPEEFAAGVIDDLRLTVGVSEFLATFTSWIRGTLPGSIELLEALRPRFTLACLSNTNALHWSRLRDDFGLGERFHRMYASFELGRMKPDAEAFRLVLDDLGRRPDEILFFDDNVECVEGARRTGMAAEHVRGVGEVREALARRGIEV